MAYRMAPASVTLNDLEGHSPVAGLFKCNPCSILPDSTDSVLAQSFSDSWASCLVSSPDLDCGAEFFWRRFGLLSEFFDLLLDSH